MSKRFFIEFAQMHAITEKIGRLTQWLADNASYCESAQKHLDAGTPEQAYWHYGYLCGLRDVVSVIRSDSAE